MQGKVYIKNYIFDLDETLYNPTIPIMLIVNRNMDLYMKYCLGINEYEIKYLREHFKKNYGTTLAGLMAEYNIDPNDFLTYVHNIDYNHYLQKDFLLINILSHIDGKLAVFTNASKKHALTILSLLGIIKFFHNIVSIEDVSFIPKPKEKSFEKLFKIIGAKPEESLFIDNMRINLHTAKKLKMKTALAWANGIAEPFDYSFPTIYDIIEFL